MRGISLLQPGMYPVAFKVTYADDLKNFHTVILNGTVGIGRTLQSSNTANQPSIVEQILSPQIIGAIIAIVAVIVFLARRKRSKNKKLKLVAQGDNDIVSIFDSVKKKDES
jgi:phosphate/sulfate permease